MLTIDRKVRIDEEITHLSEEMVASKAGREAIAPDNSIVRLSRLESGLQDGATHGLPPPLPRSVTICSMLSPVAKGTSGLP